MSDLEYEVLDELYFVIHFNQLAEATGLSIDDLSHVLRALHSSGWLRVYKTVSEELADANLNPEAGCSNYFYLASKAGLLAHNSR